MGTAITKALDQSRAIFSSAHSFTSEKRKRGQRPFDFSPVDVGYFGNQLQGANESRYALFRGWVHAAVNALAMKGASQPAMVGRLAQEGSDSPNRVKDWQERLMGRSTQTKASDQEVQILLDHPVLRSIEQPNRVQGRWQFVYSFIANLALTGWSFIVGDETDDGELEFFSIPTTWVRPDHREGAFSRFYISNPRNPTATSDEPLDRSQVAFAFMPNPGDPFGALSPAGAQQPAIRVDDFIQESQTNFFRNGIFPSVIITMGTQPHPDVPGGIRPRLTASQRRQVHGAIRKVSGGIANYGNPAIVDGMIESIERLSATQTEMGWEKSEEMVKTRILSAFGVHPFILGERVPGSYAQAYVVKEVFFDRVNCFLDMLSNLMTNFSSDLREEEDLLVWWEELVAKDPAMEKALWEGARTREDVTQNEFRAFMGLPPDEDDNQAILNKSVIQHVISLVSSVHKEQVPVDSGVAVLEGLGIPSKQAKKMIGKPKPKPKPAIPMLPGAPGAPPNGQPPLPGQPTNGQPNGAPGAGDEVERAAEEIRKAALALARPLELDIEDVLAKSRVPELMK